MPDLTRRRLLILHETPVLGGAEKYLLDLTGCAVHRRIDVTVCLCEAYTPDALVLQLHDAGVKTDRMDLDLAFPRARRIIPAFWRLLRKHRPDVVLFNKRINWYDFRHMILAAKLMRQCMVAVEHWHPEGWPTYPRRRLGPALNIRQHVTKAKCASYAHCLDEIICMNDAARARFVSEYGYPAKRTHVVYNGVDTQRFAFDQESRAKWRERLGATPTEVLLVAAGRLSAEKGIDLLLRAISILRNTCSLSLRVAIAGDGPEREALEALSKSLSIEDRISFLGTQGDMPGLLAAADIFVAPSRRESFGLSIAEAMAAGRCVVAARVGGVPELLSSTAVGMLIPAECPVELAKAIEACARDGEIRVRLGEAARAHVRAHFDLRRSMERTLELVMGHSS